MNRAYDVIVMNSHGIGQVCYVKRLPVMGETLRAWNWHIPEDGGKGCTVAVSLGRLGADTAFIGKVGNDAWGELGFKWMEAAGVNCDFLYTTDEVATGTGLIMIDEEGNNTIVDGDSSFEKLEESEIDDALEAMKGSKLFITGFGMPEGKALYGARKAKSLGMTTLLNPSPLPDQDMGGIDYIDFIVLNEVEAKALAGLPNDTDKSYEEIARLVKEKQKCQSVVMTLGKDGAVTFHEGKVTRFDPIRVDVVDTTGAGDCFLGAFTAQLALGRSVEDAAYYAVRSSALKVTRQGTIPAFPFKSEVEEFIAQHP